jgi:hypothetical protein
VSTPSGLTAPVRYEQVPIGVLLASSPDAATMVAKAILGPVLALPEAECDGILTTLRVWFADEGSTSAAAEPCTCTATPSATGCAGWRN